MGMVLGERRGERREMKFNSPLTCQKRRMLALRVSIIFDSPALHCLWPPPAAAVVVLLLLLLLLLLPRLPPLRDEPLPLLHLLLRPRRLRPRHCLLVLLQHGKHLLHDPCHVPLVLSAGYHDLAAHENKQDDLGAKAPVDEAGKEFGLVAREFGVVVYNAL